MDNEERFILGIQTSPNVDGMTATMTNAVLKGAEEFGLPSKLLNLRKMNILACLACDTGWGTCRTDGTCRITDDFARVRELMENSQGIVFATPVYFGDLSEVAKSFLDRLRRCEINFPSRSRIRGAPTIAIAAAGGSGGGVNRTLRNLERYLKCLQMNILDLFAVTQRNKARQQELLTWAGRSLAESTLGRTRPDQSAFA